MAHPASSAAEAHVPPVAPEHHGSFWPLYLTLGTTLFLLGSINHLLAIPGFLLMVASVAGWVREDVVELSHKPYQSGHSDYWLGTIVLILSEVIIFGVLFSFYFWSRSHSDTFVPEQILRMDLSPIVFNTVVLLSSGATVHTAQVYLKKGEMKRFRIWLAATIMLGAVFILGQAREYVHLTSEGLTPAASVYGTSFFSLTGVHGLHVLAGLVVLSTILALSFTPFITKERVSGVEGAFIYWHFVDAIWVLVFTIVYLRLI